MLGVWRQVGGNADADGSCSIAMEGGDHQKRVARSGGGQCHPRGSSRSLSLQTFVVDEPNVEDQLAALAAGAEHPNLSIATFTQWHLANFLLRTGRTEDAIAVLETLAPQPTMPGRNGLDLLTKINAVQRQ